MKAKFLALAALVLGLASCQTDPQDLDVTTGGEQAVTINVALPEEVTRAAGSDSALGGIGNVDLGKYDIRYILEVYDENGVLAKDRMVQTSDATSANFDLRLVPGRAYNFVVWADFVTDGTNDLYYDTSAGLRNVQVKDDKWDAIIEARDAYTDVFTVHEFSSTSIIDMTLTRPFAKLRVVTDDIDEMISIRPAEVKVKYFNTKFYTTFDAFAETASGVREDKELTVTLLDAQKNGVDTYTGGLDAQEGVQTLFADYFFGAEDDRVMFTFDVKDNGGRDLPQVTFNTNIPVKRNNLTTVYGPILTDANKVKVTIDSEFAKPDIDIEWKEASTAQDLVNIINEVNNSSTDEETHIVLGDDINLNDLFSTFSTRAAYTALTIANGKTISIDLNKKTLSATTEQSGGNQELFLVKGKLTIKNGTIEYEHKGQNMGWGAMTTIFNVTAGGVLNLEGVTATNKGGSDMGFVAHLNNWGEVTLNVDNCTLESNYVPIRVFNSGNDMNNVTIKNSTLKGVSAAFWVHNYTVEDFGSEAKAEAQKKLLNLNIYKQGNTFSPDVNGIRYGFTNSIKTDAYGITKVVSEDGTEVTLGTIFEDNTIRRGVAGAEENTTIKKVVVEEGIAVLYDRTFRRFYALEEVVLPSTLTTIGAAGSGVFQSCTNLKNIVIPESVTVLGKGSFQECTSLESINIPTGVTRIESDALRNTGLKSVEFHAGVTYFGAQAFRDCKQLTEVVINAPEFTMEGNTFGIMAAPYTPMTIHVANAEMKDYVVSKLTDHCKTYITVKAPVAVTDKASLQAAMAEAIKAGEKNIYIDGTNFSGDLNYGFSNANLPAGVTVTIRNAKVTATSKWNYLNGTLIFENCEFTAGLYSIHFDDNDSIGDVIFKNCKLVGWLPFAAINSVSFENCHLTGNGSYALIRSYADLTLKNCVIDTTNANHNDEYTDGVQAIAPATLTEENVTYIDNHTAYLQNVLKAGKHVVLSSDMNEVAVNTKAPYGNYYGFAQNGGIFDGKNYLLDFERGTQNSNGKYDNYGIMTSGGTIKNMSITGVFRGIMIMNPTQDIYVEHVTINDPDDYGVCYAINTGEGDGTKSLYVSNSTLYGWTSFGTAIKDAHFTDCSFGQGLYYPDVNGRLVKPYVNTVFDGCNFCSKYYIDLSTLVADQKVIVKNCTVNGVKITAENWTSLVAPEDTCGEGQISVELKNGTYLTAENVADYIVFE